MENRPIIALDFQNKKGVMAFLDQFPHDESLFVKVGMELFYKEGPAIVTELKARGHDVFLDLKLHDIPNTVEKAMYQLASLGVTMTNVHAAGGVRMMEAARAGLVKGSQDTNQPVPLLIAVTQLTSTTEDEMQADQNIQTSLNESVLHYAQKTKEAGLDGVVCSAKEAMMIQKNITPPFLTVCPGIRLHETNDDQRRVLSPYEAKQQGASMIVVGRPITQSSHPYEAYKMMKEDWSR